MPYSVYLSPTSGPAVIRLAGIVTGADILSASLELFLDPGWPPGAPTLWDARDAHTVHIKPEDLDRLAGFAEEIATRRGPGRTAIVSAHPYAQMCLALFWMKTRGEEACTFRVFDHLSPAEAWLAEDATPGRPD